MSNLDTVYKAERVSFSYGKNRVLTDISFEIPEGKITTLIGANGCGKSTLFQILTRNLQPENGKVWLENDRLDGLKLKELAQRVAIVHQYHTAPPDLTVEKLVAYGRLPHQRIGRTSNHKMEQEKIDWALSVTHTEKFRDVPVASLSGGQKQRVWIAMALAQDTKILLLDEPTTYLDIRYQLQILHLIRMLNETYGITIIMVLHDMNQAMSYSNYILAMKSGQIIARGTPNEIMNEQLLKDVYNVELSIHTIDGQKCVLPV